MQAKIMEQVNNQLGELLKNSPLQNWEKNIKAIILAILNKLDLVTREEFDTQQKVLLSTRKKVEELEHKLAQLSSNDGFTKSEVNSN